MKRQSPTVFAGRIALLLVSTLMVGGCSTDIMRGYIGRPPESVMAKYGPPIDVRDLPGGRRAYQWLEESTTTTPGTATTRVEHKGRGNRHPEIKTEYTPSTTETDRCFYTFYANRVEDGWLIYDFEKPRFGC